MSNQHLMCLRLSKSVSYVIWRYLIRYVLMSDSTKRNIHNTTELEHQHVNQHYILENINNQKLIK